MKSIPKGENNLFCYETLYNQQFCRENETLSNIKRYKLQIVLEYVLRMTLNEFWKGTPEMQKIKL